MQSVEEAFLSGCKGKRRHPTEEAAYMALEMLKKRKNCQRKTKLVVYSCRFGEHWHIGRLRKARPKKRK